MARKKKAKTNKTVKTIKHSEAGRVNIPTAEYQSVMSDDDKTPIQVAYERRNRDLDPQLVWRGKDQKDWSDLVVQAPPVYIQEKVHPKVLIDDLLRHTEQGQEKESEQTDLFADFNGLPDDHERTEFYQHEGKWQNRMILGDSLQVMASLAEREGLRGKVQCIYIDPPYGIKFNSNFQWSTTSRDVKDGKADHITREPEQVKAFRDTWRDGIHSYLTYLRDRLTVARDLLTESGSIFVQIGDENLHRVRSLLDEVFGDENFVSQINVVKTSGLAAASRISNSTDYILWYAKSISSIKYRALPQPKDINGPEGINFRFCRGDDGLVVRLSANDAIDAETTYRYVDLTKPGPGSKYDYVFQGSTYRSGNRWWGTTPDNLDRLAKTNRLGRSGSNIAFLRAWKDYNVTPLDNVWTDTGTGGFLEPKIYVVQTIQKIIQRCILLSTDPGDLVIDPTCGSGTSAYVAEQWGRRWITIDTSRVALALARGRIMGTRYPYYLLADSPEGEQKEAEITRTAPSTRPTGGNISHGFVYERVPHITLKSIANNTEIDVIWEKTQPAVELALADLNQSLAGHKTPFNVETGARAGQEIDFQAKLGETVELPSGEFAPKNGLLEWEVPREPPADWPKAAKEVLEEFWQARIARQKEIDASIAARADFEYLYDKPYEDKKVVRVAGPFTVESLSPHRVFGVDENDELIDPLGEKKGEYAERDFVQIILENLKTAGVQQAHKEDHIQFTALKPWPGELICAEGTYIEGDEESGNEKRAGIFIGPEFGTVSRPDLVAAAREAADADFDVLIACAFNYEAHASEFRKLGRIPVLKARMNADLHMAEDLKNTGKGNLFVIFGEPDIDIIEAEGDQIQVKVNGVDVFDPGTGEVRADGPDGIACWFIDTDYNEESFFVRQAYFLGANDPYKALKTTLKAEIDQEAWETLHSDTSRPFPRPESGRIAVKVINHLGDEVMKVYRLEARS